MQQSTTAAMRFYQLIRCQKSFGSASEFRFNVWGGIRRDNNWHWVKTGIKPS
jgi:hypothetical protein